MNYYEIPHDINLLMTSMMRRFTSNDFSTFCIYLGR